MRYSLGTHIIFFISCIAMYTSLKSIPLGQCTINIGPGWNYFTSVILPDKTIVERTISVTQASEISAWNLMPVVSCENTLFLGKHIKINVDLEGAWIHNGRCTIQDFSKRIGDFSTYRSVPFQTIVQANSFTTDLGLGFPIVWTDAIVFIPALGFKYAAVSRQLHFLQEPLIYFINTHAKNGYIGAQLLLKKNNFEIILGYKCAWGVVHATLRQSNNARLHLLRTIPVYGNIFVFMGSYELTEHVKIGAKISTDDFINTKLGNSTNVINKVEIGKTVCNVKRLQDRDIILSLFIDCLY